MSQSKQIIRYSVNTHRPAPGFKIVRRLLVGLRGLKFDHDRPISLYPSSLAGGIMKSLLERLAVALQHKKQSLDPSTLSSRVYYMIVSDQKSAIA